MIFTFFQFCYMSKDTQASFLEGSNWEGKREVSQKYTRNQEKSHFKNWIYVQHIEEFLNVYQENPEMHPIKEAHKASGGYHETSTSLTHASYFF